MFRVTRPLLSMKIAVSILRLLCLSGFCFAARRSAVPLALRYARATMTERHRSARENANVSRFEWSLRARCLTAFVIALTKIESRQWKATSVAALIRKILATRTTMPGYAVVLAKVAPVA